MVIQTQDCIGPFGCPPPETYDEYEERCDGISICTSQARTSNSQSLALQCICADSRSELGVYHFLTLHAGER